MTANRFTALRCQVKGVEAVEAETARTFDRHIHEQFGIGLIARGAQRSASGRGPVEAVAGDVITVNPGEVHDGAPVGDGGRAWRMLYLAPAVIDRAAADISDGRRGGASVEFTHPALRDARLASGFQALFTAATSGQPLDALLLPLLAGLLAIRPRSAAPLAAGIAVARQRMDDDPAAVLTLEVLARDAGLGRYQFLRGFARATGLTPHAYLLQRRVNLARRLVADGVPLAEAAVASGFSDQSHMTRLFVRTFGMGPGAYAQAVR